MNEEEKKAIEELSKKAVICNYEERDYPNMICFKKDMIIALNLIEKLQKKSNKMEVHMTIKHVQEIIKKAMYEIETVDFFNNEKRRENQKKLNKAYNILDKFNDELIREQIKNKQKEGTNEAK